jgi:hypothetical protein
MNLDERATRAASAVREEARRVDPAAILARIEERSTRRRWLAPTVALAGSAAVVAVAVALLVGPGPGGVEIGPDPAGTPTTDQEPDGDGSPDGGSGESDASAEGSWERVVAGSFEGQGDDRMRAVAHGGVGATVAVGRRADGPGIWLRDAHRPPDEPDAWEQVGADLCGEASCELHDVATFRDGFVAVGTLDGLPKVWTSDDGRAWQRVDLEPPAGPSGEAALTAVAGGVAFGSQELTEGGSRPVVYAADADGWAAQEVAFDFEEAAAHVVDAVQVGGGRVLAVGYVGDGVAIWTEQDGVWRETFPEGEQAEFSTISTVVTSLQSGIDGELLMTGSAFGGQDSDGRVWRSTDGGATWDRMPGELGGPGDQHVNDLLFAGGSFVAVGRTSDGAGGDPRPAAWILREEGWEPMDGGDAFATAGAIEAAVATDGHAAIAVGTSGGGGDANEGAAPADAAVWLYGTPEGPGEPPDADSAADPSSGAIARADTPEGEAAIELVLDRDVIGRDEQVSFQLVNRGEVPLLTGYMFRVQRLEGDRWVDVEPGEVRPWPLAGIELDPGEGTDAQTWPFDDWWNHDGPGRYRILEDADWLSSGRDADVQFQAVAEFTIE